MDGDTTPSAAPALTFLDLIVAILTPIFLPYCIGNPANAQLLALETIQEYGRNSHRNLIAIARALAFDLAALAALGESVQEELPITQALRLRQNALSCDRVAERARKQIDAAPEPSQPAAPPPEVPEDERIHRTTLANAMLGVARDLTTEAAQISPALVKESEIHANILRDAARTLIAGMPAPETPLPRIVTANLREFNATPPPPPA